MKKAFVMTTLCLGLFACGNNNAGSGEQQENKPKTEMVEVLYFHGKQRCPTCRAIEKETKELVSTTFADDMKKGKLIFKTLDIDENEAIADKYQVTWSSLILVDYDGGKEKYEDMTKFAFGNARKSPDAFKNGLAEKIKEMLN